MVTDNVTLSQGTEDGPVVGADSVTIGGVEQMLQRVKLYDGTDGGTDPIPGDAAHGLDVDVTRLPALVANSGVDIGDVTVNNAAGAPVPVQLSDGSAVQVLATADYDSAAGTVTRVMVGIALPGSGGPVAGGTSANPVRTDPTGSTAQPITDNGGSLTVDGTVTVNALPAGTNNIGDVDVLTLPALPTGTNTIGSVKLTDGTTVATVVDLTNTNPLAVAIVDGNGDQITSFAGGGGSGTQYTEDAAAAANPVGDALIMVRADALAGITTTDGDNVAARGTDKGELYVKHVDAVPVTDNGGTLSIDDGAGSITVDGTVAATIAAGATAIAKAEDAASASGDVGVPAMAVQLATPTDLAGTDADYAMLQMAGGRLWTSTKVDTALPAGGNAIGKLAANSGVDIGDVDVTTVGTITPGTAASSLGKAEDAAHASGDVGVMAMAVREATPTDLSAGNTDGDYEPLQVGRDGALWVGGVATHKGGWSIATGSIAATKTDVGTANTPGQVGGWYIYNPNASVAYVQFFNAQASAVTLGTTAPVYSLGIPAGSAANVAPGMVGLLHATAISIAVTTTRAGATGPGSTVDFNVWFKQ